MQVGGSFFLPALTRCNGLAFGRGIVDAMVGNDLDKKVWRAPHDGGVLRGPALARSALPIKIRSIVLIGQSRMSEPIVWESFVSIGTLVAAVATPQGLISSHAEVSFVRSRSVHYSELQHVGFPRQHGTVRRVCVGSILLAMPTPLETWCAMNGHRRELCGY